MTRLDYLRQRVLGHLDKTASPPPFRGECVHLGRVLDRLGCNCPGRWVRECQGGHGQCTTRVGRQGLACCDRCSDHEEV